MEIRKVSDSVSIYSDGKRLQVIHDLGECRAREDKTDDQ